MLFRLSACSFLPDDAKKHDAQILKHTRLKPYVTRFYKTNPNCTSGKTKLTPPVDSYTIVLIALTLSITQLLEAGFNRCLFWVVCRAQMAVLVIVIVIVIVIFKQGVHSVKLIFSGALNKHTIDTYNN